MPSYTSTGKRDLQYYYRSLSLKDLQCLKHVSPYDRPDLIQYDRLSKSNAMYNLNNAFDVADREFGLVKLLDAEDVDVEMPDEKSVITYVVTYYHYFSKWKQETVQGKRIAKVVGLEMELDRMIEDYEGFTSDLLKWIENIIAVLGDRNFSNSLKVRITRNVMDRES